MTSRAKFGVIPALLALGLVSSLASLDGGAATAASSPSTNPVASTSGGVNNVTFYYGGNTRLRTGEDLSVLGRPSIVVTTSKGPGTDAEAIQAIHSINAKAYRYVQFYWAPDDADYEGINLYEHPEWAFCGAGGSRVLGRKTDGSRHWYFLDANERSLREHLRSLLDQYKAAGWDGVMFDRGEAATQYAKDINGHPVWYKRSTCTSDPYQPGARFSDAYVNMLGLAHEAGLQTMMNNGKSPFDPVTRMRPDPANANCQKARWSKCRYLSDIWSKVDLVLNEASTRPKDDSWHRNFVGNQRSEQSAAYKRRTVALITTASLRGAKNQKRSTVFYAWSRIKLFDLAVSVNTGDGGCGGASGGAVCNRYGTYPELTNVDFGKVQGTKPMAMSCAKPSKVHCVWVRRYGKGMNVLNVRGIARTVTVGMNLASCRYVYDVYAGKPLAGNKCVKTVKIKVPAWSGRPLTYSTGQYS